MVVAIINQFLRWLMQQEACNSLTQLQ